MLSVEKLVQQARQAGWACVEGRIDSVPYQVAHLGWTIVPTRKGGPAMETLTPVTKDEAPKQSLSATVGLDAQPLHTDGAHHPSPPDVVLLSAEAPSEVPTLLWEFSTVGISTETMQDLRHGIFVVRSGNDAMLAPALESGRVRFDPGCMSAGDSRSRRVGDFFSAKLGEATQHEWTGPGLILAIDNRKVLHARGAVKHETDRSLHRIAIRTGVIE